MAPLLTHYLSAHEALSDDSQAGVKNAAKAIKKLATQLPAVSTVVQHSEHHRGLPARIAGAADALGKAATLKEARAAFKDLSRPLAMWGTMARPSSTDVAFCSMAKGSWLQKEGPIRNPYYGKSMLRCGVVVGGVNHRPEAAAR
ncbi:MAG: hypothetical protein CME06_06320 [Gemmatimonadetes bacterium]|nr:hypothetical protein [Gemmatimonadota bacterium]